MIRLVRLAKGMGALVVLGAIVLGIPWALWHFIGWPLPHTVPDWDQVRRGLDQRGIPDQVLIKALASVVWITWATLVASIAVEIPAALGGRHAPRLPLAGIFQPMTGRLPEPARHVATVAQARIDELHTKVSQFLASAAADTATPSTKSGKDGGKDGGKDSAS